MKLSNKQKQIIISLLTICVAFLAIIDAAILNMRCDFTSDHTYRISKVSKETLRNLEEPIKISFYISDKVVQHRPFAQTTIDLVSEIAASSRGRVKLQIVDPIKHNVGQQDLRDISPWQLQSSDGLTSASVDMVYSGIVMDYKNKRQTIALINEYNYEQIEYEIISKVRKMAYDYQLRVALLNLSSRPNLPLQREEDVYYCGYNALIEQSGGLYQDFSFEEIQADTVIDNSYTAVVVVGAKEVSEKQLLVLDQYIMRGGKVLFIAERQQILFDLQNQQMPIVWDSMEDSLLLSYFRYYGVDFEDGKLADLNANQTLSRSGDSFSLVPIVFNPKIVRSNKNFPFHTTFQELTLLWPDAIKIAKYKNQGDVSQDENQITNETDSFFIPDGVNITPLLRSSNKAVIVKNPEPRAMLDSSMGISMYNSAAQNPTMVKSYPVSVLVSGTLPSYFADNKNPIPANQEGLFETIVKKSDVGRFILISDTEFISDFAFSAGQDVIRGALLYIRDVAEYLGGDEELLKVRTKIPPARIMHGVDKNSKGWVALLAQIVNIVLIPLAIVLFALVWLILRNRRTRSHNKKTKSSMIKESSYEN